MKVLALLLFSFAYAHQLTTDQVETIQKSLDAGVKVETLTLAKNQKTIVFLGESHVKNNKLAHYESNLIDQFNLRFLEGMNSKQENLSFYEKSLLFLTNIWIRFQKNKESMSGSSITKSIQKGISITNDRRLILGHCYFNYPNIAELMDIYQIQDIEFATSEINLESCPDKTPLNYFIEIGNLDQYKSDKNCSKLFCDDRRLASARDRRMAENIWSKMLNTTEKSILVIVGKKHVQAIKNLLAAKASQTEELPLQLSLHQHQQK